MKIKDLMNKLPSFLASIVAIFIIIPIILIRYEDEFRFKDLLFWRKDEQEV